MAQELYRNTDDANYKRILTAESFTNYDFILLREGRDNTAYKEYAEDGDYPTVVDAKYQVVNPQGGVEDERSAGVSSYKITSSSLEFDYAYEQWLSGQKGASIVAELKRCMKESLDIHKWSATSFDTYPSSDAKVSNIAVTSVVSANNVYYHKLFNPNFISENPTTISWEWYPENFSMDAYTHLALMRLKGDIDSGAIDCSDTIKDMVKSIQAGKNDPDAVDWVVNIDTTVSMSNPIITLTWRGRNEYLYKHASIQMSSHTGNSYKYLGTVTYDSQKKTYTFKDLFVEADISDEPIDFIKGIIGEITGGNYVDFRFKAVYTDPLTTTTKFTAECHAKIYANGDCSDYGIYGTITDGSTVTITRVNTDDVVPPYDPDDPGGDINDPDDPMNPIVGPIQAISGVSLLTKSYVVTEAQLKALGQKLWSQSLIENIFEVNQNPVENIISAKAYVFNIPHQSNVAEIVLGNYPTGINGYPIAENTNFVINVGTFKLPSYYGHSWLDYKMTSMSIYLPFCGGLHPLDVFNYMDRTITVKYFVDTITGTCKAVLFSGKVIIDEFAGQMGVDIPITAQNRASQELAQITSVVGGGAAAGIALAASDGALLPALPGIMSGVQGLINGIIRPKDAISHVGSNSPTCSMMTTHDVFLVVNRPRITWDVTSGKYGPTNYGRTYGYPAYYKSVLQNLKGFTQCENVDLENVSCTAEERDMIKQHLERGVYIE